MSLPVPESVGRDALPRPAADLPGRSGEQQSAAPESGAVPVGVEFRTRFAEETHQYIREFIRNADQKAIFFFTGATALLAFMYRSGMSASWLKPVMQWNVLDLAAFVAMAALAVSALLALWVVIPRTAGSMRGYLFWEAIAEFDSGSRYADELSTLSAATLFRVKAEHCYVLAIVCRRKYKWLRLALSIGLLGLAAALAVLLFS